MASYRTITIKGIEQILQALCTADPRVADFRLGDTAMGDGKDADSYPLVMWELSSAVISTRASMHYTDWSVMLYCFTMRRSDSLNVVDAFSETQTILSDIYEKFTSEDQFIKWGFEFGERQEMQAILREDRDDLIGYSIELKFSTPLMQCSSELPGEGLPDFGLYYSGSTSQGRWLTCATLQECEVIQGIQASIAAISGSTSIGGLLRILPGTNILTGGTASAITVSVNTSPSFNVISADNAILKFLQVDAVIQTDSIVANTSVYAPSIGADVLYSGGTDLSLLLTGGSKSLTVRDEVSTFYAILPSDNYSCISTTSASAVQIGIDNDSNILCPNGTQVMIKQGGAGQVRFLAAPGVTIQSYGSAYNLVGQFATAVITKITANQWVLDGNLTTLNL